MIRSKWYLISYIGAIFVLIAIYATFRVEAKSTEAFFAAVDLPPGAVLSEKDIVYGEGVVLEHEKERLIPKQDLQELVGKRVVYGIRKGRPILLGDLEDGEKLHEMKLVGDITIPETAKVVSVILIPDERNYPGMGPKVLAENVPVVAIYNNNNLPIDMSDPKRDKVPKAISILVTEKQRDLILSYKNKGTFHFTTIP